jgi:hypothetical protein
VTIETSYGGWADNEAQLLELQVKKSDITAYLKPKPTPADAKGKGEVEAKNTFRVQGSHRTEAEIKQILGRDPDIHSGMLPKGNFNIKVTDAEFAKLKEQGIKITVDKRFPATPVPTPKEAVKKEETKEPGTKPLPVEKNIESDDELPSETSARNASIAEDRESMGLDKVASATRKGWKESLKNAKKKNIADNALRIAAEVNKKPRAMTDEETAGMVIKAARLKNEHKTLSEKIKQIPGNDTAAIKSLSSEMEVVESEFEALSDALKLSGTEMGRALASRKLTINNSYDLVSVAVRAKAVKGEALSTEERQKLADLTTKLDAATAKIDALQKQVDESTANNAIKEHGVKRYSRMSLEQKDTELNSLVSEVNRLLKEGCY